MTSHNQAHHQAQESGPWYTAFFRNGHLLALSIIIILVAGISAITSLPRLEDPRIDLRNVLVLTSYPGASAERVEALVSDVLEDELRQLYEVKEIKSTSTAGFSTLFIELQNSIDNSNNQQVFSKIRDAIGDASKRFPAGAGEPLLEDKRGATAFTIMMSINAKYPHANALTQAGRMANELSDSLRNVTGTEIVRIYGEPTEEVTVTIQPQQLALSGLSLQEVSQRIASADAKLPAGVLISHQNDMRVQVAQPLSSVDELGQIPIQTSNGAYLRLQDIATIEKNQRTPVSEIAMVDGKQTIFVSARMQTTVRVDKWTQAIKEKVEQFNDTFGDSFVAEVIFEQNKYTEQRLSELSMDLVMGSLVVILVVLFFMGIKASLIVGLALPLCAAFAIFSLGLFNQQIHQMSIFGIIIAIGLLIDNAIVVTDEIRLNLQDHTMSRLAVLKKSVRHLFSPLLASTLTTILGFMPIFLLNGNIGDFIGSIAISVVMALIGSLAISLTIIAALAARYLSRDGADAPWYKRGYQLPQVSLTFRMLIGKAIKRPILVLPAVVIVCLMGFVLSSQLPNVFFPSADRDQFEVYMILPDGSSIERSHELAQQANTLIAENDGIEQITWMIGASTPSIYYNQVQTRDNASHFANAVITADSVARADALVVKLQYDLQDVFPNAQVVSRKFGQGPPIAAPIEVHIYGSDLQVLDSLGQQVRNEMTHIPGVTQSLVTISTGEPELLFDLSENQSYLSQLSLTQIAQQLQAALGGTTGGSILEGTEELDIRVRVNDGNRSNIQQLDAMPLIAPGNDNQRALVGVASLGTLTLKPSISSITRIDGERVNKIQAYLLPGVAAVSSSEALRERIAQNVHLPQGYRIRMAGDADEQGKALGQLATYLPVLLVLMLTSLILSFSSVRFAAVIGVVAVLSVGLGFFSLWLSGLPIGFNPLLGSAGLIGVAINGSIVVIAAIAANPKAMQGDTVEIVTETMSCSRHILSTTVTTVGGLIPLLLFSDGSFWPPLAVVLAGGVGFSVILSLLFTPVIVAALCRLRVKRQARKAKNMTNKDEMQLS